MVSSCFCPCSLRASLCSFNLSSCKSKPWDKFGEQERNNSRPPGLPAFQQPSHIAPSASPACPAALPIVVGQLLLGRSFMKSQDSEWGVPNHRTILRRSWPESESGVNNIETRKRWKEQCQWVCFPSRVVNTSGGESEGREGTGSWWWHLASSRFGARTSPPSVHQVGLTLSKGCAKDEYHQWNPTAVCQGAHFTMIDDAWGTAWLMADSHRSANVSESGRRVFTMATLASRASAILTANTYFDTVAS